MINKLYKLCDKSDGQEIKKELMKKWSELETIDNLFRYKLKVEHQKITNGKLNFLIQVNFVCNRSKKTF